MVRIQDLLGRLEEMAALQCFLMAGCGRLLCLARAQQLLRRTRSTSATRAGFCPQAHTLPPQDQGRRRLDDGGAGFSLRLRETCALCQWGSDVLLRITRGRAAKHSKLHRVGGKAPDHKHTQHNCATLPLSLNILIYTEICASWHYFVALKEYRSGVE